MTVPILRGALRGKKWIVGSQRHAFWLGVYEPHMQELIAREVRPGSIFWDVGANVGFYSLLASTLVGTGKVFAFEPLPSNVTYLYRHLALNNIKNAEVLELAICDRVGYASFAPEGTGAMGHLQDQGTLSVATETLDSLLQGKKIPPPEYIKMDIEGAEYAALLGGQSCFGEHKPVLFLATHGRQVREQCQDLLRSWHYELQVVGNPSLDRAEIFCRPMTKREF